MKIVLNFLGLRVGGGRTDAINILFSLPRIADTCEFLAIVPESCGYEKIDLNKNCEVISIPTKKLNNVWRLYFDNFVIPKMCKEFGADTLFTMCNNGPLRVPCRHVVMLRRPQLAYDKVELGRAKIKTSFKLFFLGWYFQKLIKNCDALIVQTEVMKRLVEKRYKVNIPVSVIGKNISKGFNTSVERGNLSGFMREHRSQNNAKLFLYLTQYYPHKNLELACEAMLKAREAGNDVCLLLTLNQDEDLACSRLLKEIENGKFKEAVKNIGHVDLSEIKSVYENVDAVFMPTLLESYSATFLEAMFYKKPLFVSDRPFAKEICGEAAVYFDPLSATSMVKAITDFDLSEETARVLTQRGEAQFEKYNVPWEKICEQYLHVISND